jgi:PHS family inorganic phosphate transporter-like MFS transporter
VSLGNTILAVAGLIPGYYATFFLIDSWGRKPIQLMGFTILTVLFIIMGRHSFSSVQLLLIDSTTTGFGYRKLTETHTNSKWFTFLYCLANFFQNFGPNTTTFVIPGEIFPTRYRSTAHGISAASGKLGAVIAQVGFQRLRNIGGTNRFIGHMYILYLFPFGDCFSWQPLLASKCLHSSC